jgi:hypothetical protein|tara:strand:- start:839 stop:1045 length:207 start_codon:yes stop_codon:yes gene_type:complete
MSLDPNSIELSKPSKAFEYEKHSRAIDEMDDIKMIKNLLKCYIKLYLKQQETLSSLGTPPAPINDGNT